jgi:hypothetical protein
MSSSSERDGQAKFVCQARNHVMDWRIMAATDEEKAKARRAIVILYICMLVGVGLPIVLYFALR